MVTRDPARCIRRWIWCALRSPRWPIPFDLKVRLTWWVSIRCRKPATFNECIRHRMSVDRRPILTTFADKVAVREYVAGTAGLDLLPQCYAIVEKPERLDRSTLPREFVVKASHGCGGVWLITEQAPLDSPHPQLGTGWAHLITHPDRLDWGLLVAICREWLALNYGRSSLEWAYVNIPPRILVEEFLGPTVPDDYKVYVFHGVPRLVQVNTARFGDARCDYYTPGWEPVDLTSDYPRSGRALARPAALDRMLMVASRLAQGLDFLRVDLYHIAGRVVFGELTNYPGAGRIHYVPRSVDVEMGRWWKVTP